MDELHANELSLVFRDKNARVALRCELRSQGGESETVTLSVMVSNAASLTPPEIARQALERAVEIIRRSHPA